MAGIGRAAVWRLAVLVAVFAVLGFVFHGRVDPAALRAWSRRVNPVAAFTLLVVLPLVGFPASVLHVAAGMRFGAAAGLALVSLSILLQLLASYALVHVFRSSFARRFERLRRRLPAEAHANLCLFAVLLPGAPFAAVNYVLPLTGVRLRTYLACCWPLHTLRSTVTVLLGDQSARLTPVRLAGLGGYALLLAGGSWWLYRRLQRQLADQPPGEDGRMQPA